MKLDDGSHEIDVTDTGGNSIEAKIDPATLDVIKAKMEEFAPEAPAPAAPSLRDPVPRPTPESAR